MFRRLRPRGMLAGNIIQSRRCFASALRARHSIKQTQDWRLECRDVYGHLRCGRRLAWDTAEEAPKIIEIAGKDDSLCHDLESMLQLRLLIADALVGGKECFPRPFPLYRIVGSRFGWIPSGAIKQWLAEATCHADCGNYPESASQYAGDQFGRESKMFLSHLRMHYEGARGEIPSW